MLPLSGILLLLPGIESDLQVSSLVVRDLVDKSVEMPYLLNFSQYHDMDVFLDIAVHAIVAAVQNRRPKPRHP